VGAPSPAAGRLIVLAAIVCGILAGAGLFVRPGARRLGASGPWPVRTAWSLVPARGRPAAPALVRRWCTRGGRRPPPAAVPAGVVLRLVDDLATQVRSGASPATAWSVATELLGRTAERGTPLAAPGEAPRDCLQRLATGPGAAPELLALSAAWALCEDVGAPLGEVLHAVADAIRQDGEIEADIESALAAPRSTARLLSLLPLAGLLLGQLVGARPGHVLLHTSAGRLCALAGLVLALVGRWWANRLVARTAALLQDR
jgi:tight adherence protein B